MWTNKSMRAHKELFMKMQTETPCSQKQNFGWVFLNDAAADVWHAAAFLMSKSTWLCKKTHAKSNPDSQRHGANLREDHRRRIFSVPQSASPGRQGWWRGGSISCSINSDWVLHEPPVHKGDPMWLSRALLPQGVQRVAVVCTVRPDWTVSSYCCPPPPPRRTHWWRAEREPEAPCSWWDFCGSESWSFDSDQTGPWKTPTITIIWAYGWK